jgi:putative peptidoglycan lipid II flippase
MSDTPSSSPPRHEPRVLRSAAVVGAMTGISRVAGLVREQLMAVAFGTGVVKSAFVVAFQIPNLFRRLFGEGALSAAFIPVYVETRKREGEAEANLLVGRVAGLLVAVLGTVTALGILAALALQRWWFAPDSRWVEILPLLRIMLPYAPLICLAALAMGVLNALKNFAVSALAPVFLNLIWIFALLAVCPLLPNDPRLRIRVVAWAVIVAGVAQVAVQVPALRRRGVRPALRFDWRGDTRIRRILALLAPMMLGVGVFQINVVVDGLLAMWAAPWAPAAIQYADLIVYLPLGLIGNAFGTVLLPTFAHQAAEDDHAAMRTTVEGTLRHVLLIALPAAAGLVALARPVVDLLYVWPRGEFQAQDAIWTTRALAVFAPGLIFFSIQKALTPAFYALQDMRTPLRIGLWSVGLNFVLNVICVLTWPEGWKHAGLLLSTVVSSALTGAILGNALHRRIGAPCWRALASTAAGVTVAACLMGGVVWWVQARTQELLSTSALPLKLAQAVTVLAAMAAGAAVYAALVWVLCRPAVRELIGDLRHRRA